MSTPAPSASAPSPQPDVERRRQVRAVTLLTRTRCELCGHAKEVLRRLQTDANLAVDLEVEEVDLDSAQGRALAAAAGVLFAPGTLFDGQPFAHGRLSERKLRRALGKPFTSPA